jgi:preprotein translocase subunit Sec63
MKKYFTYILSLFILFGTVPTVSAMDYSEKAGMEEVKKKKKSKKKKIKKGKKKKKGFFSKVFGSK